MLAKFSEVEDGFQEYALIPALVAGQKKRLLHELVDEERCTKESEKRFSGP